MSVLISKNIVATLVCVDQLCCAESLIKLNANVFKIRAARVDSGSRILWCSLLVSHTLCEVRITIISGEPAYRSISLIEPEIVPMVNLRSFYRVATGTQREEVDSDGDLVRLFIVFIFVIKMNLKIFSFAETKFCRIKIRGRDSLAKRYVSLFGASVRRVVKSTVSTSFYMGSYRSRLPPVPFLVNHWGNFAREMPYSWNNPLASHSVFGAHSSDILWLRFYIFPKITFYSGPGVEHFALVWLVSGSSGFKRVIKTHVNFIFNFHILYLKYISK